MGIDDLERLFKSIVAAKAESAAADRTEPVYDLLDLLRFIAGGSPEVPPGWVRLQCEAQHRLTAAMSAVPGRSAIRVTAVCAFSSRPAFRLTADDAVVRGIYRRTLAKARHTCQACGRAGRVWESLSQHRVLCPRCAAPEVVAADLDNLEMLGLRVRHSMEAVPVTDIPARLVDIVAVALDASERDGSLIEGAKPRVFQEAITPEEFERWCNWLRQLRESPALVDALRSVR
jgi:Zn finger protein HypA/HybF involved in hydrogenase expression